MTTIRIQPIGARAPMVPTERCPVVGKRRFPTLESADAALTAWSETTTWDGHAYRCEHCDGYHLTHMTQPAA